jgi:prepilin-type N-terminal cleavage/methylation domain-containing protein
MLWRENAIRAALRMQGRRSGGFTLIEILAVVIILGIASAIIVPQIGTRSDLLAAAGARAVMADLLYAQNRAISTQQMQYVSFSTAGQNYGEYSNTPLTNANLLTQPVNGGQYLMTFGGNGPNAISSVSLTSANFGAGSTTVAFDEMGTPYYYNGVSTTLLSGTGAVVVTSGNYAITINIAQDTGDITTTP